MTYNLYLGADLTPIVIAPPEDIPQVVSNIVRQVNQTNFPQRSKSIARLIKRTRPDLIGLQEVAFWSVKSTTGKSVLNFLNILLNDLRNMGLRYRVIALNRNFLGQLPDASGSIVKFLDRDVILARCNAPFKITNKQEKNFQTNLTLEVAGQPFTILRGYSFVDITFPNHNKVRFLNTHLEPDSAEVRLAQAKELISNPLATSLPVVAVGDFNSNPANSTNQAYRALINAGFKDAWNIAGRGPGFTALQAPNLLNPISTLKERIDFILYRNALVPKKKNKFIQFKVQQIRTIGDTQRNRTPSGLWPSDHAGVVGQLRII